MRSLVARRWLLGSLAVLVAVLLLLWIERRYPSLREAAFFTGWVLAGMVVFLALYNLRKKLAYPPLLSSATWLQLHVYVGLLSIVVFIVHVDLGIPTGPFEMTLAAIFALVAGSGVVGLLLSRAIPPRLTARGSEVLFERIAVVRRQLRDEAETLVIESAATRGGGVLAEFYRRKALPFLEGPRHFWHHVVQTAGPSHGLLAELRSLERYLDDAERARADELARIIESKATLDYHWAMQGVLKGWLFVHLPLTYVLLVLLVVHAVLVHTFDHTP